MLNYQTISIKKIVSDLINKKTTEIHLFDREIGQKIRERIEQQISEFTKSTVHFLDFGAISSIDFSCADELVGKLISRLISDEYGSNFLVLENLTKNQQENIQVVLDRRKVACLEKSSKDHWQYHGHRKNSLLETLNIIMKHGEMTARELSKQLNLELTNSSTRLSQLYKAHLVNRVQIIVDGGGMEYLYQKLF